MEDKNRIIGNPEINGKNVKSKLHIAFENKILYFQEIIRKTIISVQKYKSMEIITANDLIYV